MKRTIYCIYDQVAQNYGGVFDFANENDMRRSLQNMVDVKLIPEYVLRDSVVFQLAEVDYSSNFPVLVPLPPVIVLRMEEFIHA